MVILTSDLITEHVNCFRFCASSLIFFIHFIDTISIISEILGMVSGRFPHPDHNKQQKNIVTTHHVQTNAS